MKIIGLILLLISLAACTAGPSDHCAAPEDCDSGLVCFAPGEAEGRLFNAHTFRELEPHLESGACVTPEDLVEAAQAYADAVCRAAFACGQSGWCTAKDGKCIAGSDEDCRSSVGCKEYGWCAAKDGECLTTSNEHCRASTAYCKEQGRCVRRDGWCMAGSDEDCRASQWCKEFGRCTARGPWCLE
jgi:hypothetical protein